MSFVQSVRLAVSNGIRYLPLLENLISRELKNKYRKSVLGYLWCVLNPLCLMLIMTFVFSYMFRNDIENYPVYLFVGRMVFSFITDSTTGLSRSIISNGVLLRKTRIPYYVFPAASFCSAVVNFGFTLIAFVIVLVFTGTPVSYHVVAFPLVLIELFMFSFGLGMILAQANTFLRDIGYLYAVMTTAWMYVTPLFYPVESLPDLARSLITRLNPAYFYVVQARQIFLSHQWPEPAMLLRGAVAGLLLLVIGLVTYARTRDKLTYYV